MKELIFPFFVMLESPPIPFTDDEPSLETHCHKFAVTYDMYRSALCDIDYRLTYHYKNYISRPAALALSCYEYICTNMPQVLFGVPVIVVHLGVAIEKDRAVEIFSKEFFKNKD